MALRNTVTVGLKSFYIHARLAEEQLRSGVAWWPLAPAFVADPYPAYRKLRDRDPVHYSILTRQFIVSQYVDVDRILRDHRSFSNDLQKARSSHGSLGTRKKLKPSMLVRDPPDHTPLAEPREPCIHAAFGREDGGLRPLHRSRHPRRG